MKDISRIESEEFEALLGWLSEEREQAGAEYNKIRDGLIRFFRFKGCSDSSALADETFNRVAKKIQTFDEPGNVKKTTIIYGFANNIALEDYRKSKRENKKSENYEFIKRGFDESNEEENALKVECMHKCLETISPEDKTIFIEYYGQEKIKKSAARRRLAERLGIEMNALQVRMFRLRGVLAKCIKNSLKKNL